MTYFIIHDNTTYQIAMVVANYKNHTQVKIHNTNTTKKIKTEDQLYQIELSNIDECLVTAKQIMATIDLNLLQELIEDEQLLHIKELSAIYFGDNYNSAQLIGLLFAIINDNIIFTDLKNANFKKNTLLKQEEQRQLLQFQSEKLNKYQIYYNLLIKQQNPNFDHILDKNYITDVKLQLINNKLDILALLYKANKNNFYYQIILEASNFLKITPHELCFNVGLIDDLELMHVKEFLFSTLPNGMNYQINQEYKNKKFSEHLRNNIVDNFDIKVFSIDDMHTTEIDDAFSVTQLNENYAIGVHIAAPAIQIELLNIVAENLSTIYYPNNKITMLPLDIIEKFTLKADTQIITTSIYFIINEEFEIIDSYSKLERIKITDNLRIEELNIDDIFINNTNDTPDSNHTLIDRQHSSHPYHQELNILYKFANKLEAERGKPATNNIALEYYFHIDENKKITIKVRNRGNQIDKLVSELMILANCSWGKMLTNAFIPAIYRVKQQNMPVHMTLTPNSHTGLNVAYYTWSSSPLRRAIDFVNQYQIINLITRQQEYLASTNPIIMHITNMFDKQYAKYIDFQNKMENYWSLRYLLQENITLTTATFIYKSKAQVDCVPLEIDTAGLINPKIKGTKINIKIFNINLITLKFEFNILNACKIESLFGSQSITLEALILPFCLSPIFIVPILKLGASAKPLELFPTTASTYCKALKYLNCPKDVNTIDLLEFLVTYSSII